MSVLLVFLLLLKFFSFIISSTIWQQQHSVPIDQFSRLTHKQWTYPSSSSSSSSSLTMGFISTMTSSMYNETTSLYLAHVTSVSYCQSKHIINWNCQPCSFVPRLQGMTVVEDAKDNFQGLVGYSELHDALIVAFRGSMDVTNWLDNLTFLKARAYPKFPSVMVHEGFYWAYRSVAPQVVSTLHKLRKKYPNASVMVTGHSLGGAVASICAFELEHIEKMPVKVLYTFGSPRVGNTNFSARLRNASMKVYRVTHFNDVVPHLPPTWTGFEHTSEEIFYDQFSTTYRKCSETNGEDPTCSNTCSPFSCTSIVDHLTYLNITMSHLVC